MNLTDLTRPGRRIAPITGRASRELSRDDLFAERSEPVQAAPLKRITERHHALARALASGMGEGEAAAMLGFAGSRVSVLKASPAFAELLALYRREKDTAFAETAARLAGLATDAVLTLQERLEDEPEKITTGQLVEIAKMAADRSGNGPSSMQVQVQVDLGERLRRARERAQQGVLIEGRAEGEPG